MLQHAAIEAKKKIINSAYRSQCFLLIFTILVLLSSPFILAQQSRLTQRIHKAPIVGFSSVLSSVLHFIVTALGLFVVRNHTHTTWTLLQLLSSAFCFIFHFFCLLLVVLELFQVTCLPRSCTPAWATIPFVFFGSISAVLHIIALNKTVLLRRLALAKKNPIVRATVEIENKFEKIFTLTQKLVEQLENDNFIVSKQATIIHQQLKQICFEQQEIIKKLN
eukprot:TRINITY_DN150_c0_g1_i1.p1 TRINITY_DN150_c0_g1~~TRINITY_DN150_c0_g1_i1.p1  ORF type:complete len:235 (-),score=73.47 TRINITY_DN150_c0_g1_i1:11-673(-)